MKQIITFKKMGLAVLLFGVNVQAQIPKTFRYKCSSQNAELVFDNEGELSPGTHPNAVGISFRLGKVSKKMSANEAKPHVAGFGSILMFDEERSGLQFTVGFFPGASGFAMANSFALEAPFGDFPGSYATIETGACELVAGDLHGI